MNKINVCCLGPDQLLHATVTIDIDSTELVAITADSMQYWLNCSGLWTALQLRELLYVLLQSLKQLKALSKLCCTLPKSGYKLWFRQFANCSFIRML